MISAAGRANRTGLRLEVFVAGILAEAGYREIAPSPLFWAMRAMEQPIYASQCEIERDIYNKRRRVDFILYHPRRWQSCLVVQCKWQASSGSVEEKYPFEVLSIQHNEYPTIVLLDGGGYTRGAEQWLRSQAGGNQLLRHVFSQGDLQRFASRGLL